MRPPLQPRSSTGRATFPSPSRSGRRTSPGCSAWRPICVSRWCRAHPSDPSATTPSGPPSRGLARWTGGRVSGRWLRPTSPIASRRSDVRRYPTSDQLLQDAAAEAKLSDFGPGDFREGLDVLVDSLEHDGDLDPGTDAAVVGDLRRRLVNRLEVEAWYVEHPEVDDVAIAGPVDINGLPRTGTTALADMLSLDPQFRCLRGWEQTRPVPPPVAGQETDDPRRQAFVRAQERRSAEDAAKHIVEVDATMEDTEILGMAFHGQQMTLPVAGYRAWWRHADLTETYEYHRRVVKLLGSRRPPERWLFKAPHHKFHLEALARAYPDVRFVMTHRDPAKVVPSYTSLVSTVFPPAAGSRDLHALGAE